MPKKYFPPFYPILTKILSGSNSDIPINLELYEKWLKAHSKEILSEQGHDKEPLDEVENALYLRATGFSYPELQFDRKESGKDENGNPLYQLMPAKMLIKTVQPDINAINTWLKVHAPEKWDTRNIRQDSLISKFMDEFKKI